MDVLFVDVWLEPFDKGCVVDPDLVGISSGERKPLTCNTEGNIVMETADLFFTRKSARMD